MKNIKLKVISMTLSGIMMLSATSCKLQKKDDKSKTIKDSSIIDFTNEEYSNIKDDHLKEIIIDLIEKIEEKNYNLPIDSFLNKLSGTVFIKNPKGEFTLGTYNEEEHTLTYVPNSDETIRHELLHMILPSYNNASIDEGLVQILLNDLYGYEIRTNLFDASLCKIFCRILNKEELEEFVLGNTDVLKNKLASIKPAYEDAEDFLVYANNAEIYYRQYNESIFDNKEEDFKNKKEYEWLKSYRKVVKDRIKIYLYNYYNTMDFSEDPYDRLVEIFEILNIVNYYMYDTSLGERNEKDYFLKPIVEEICNVYSINNQTLVSADDKAKECESFKYLDKLNDNTVKNK